MFNNISHHEQSVITPASSQHAAKGIRIVKTRLLFDCPGANDVILKYIPR